MSEEPSIDEVLQLIHKTLERRVSIGENIRILFAQQCGSWAYNLNVSTSDKDYFAIFEAPVDKILSLTPPAQTVDQHMPDIIIYEIGYYCKLLMKGNPKVIEPLFADHLCYIDGDWKSLRQIRAATCCQTAVRQYTGYALGKLKEAASNKGQGAAKSYYHAIRLLQEALRISKGEGPKVWMEGNDREYLMQIRRGEVSQEHLLEQAKELQQQIDIHMKSLPKEADQKKISDWLVQHRLKSLKKLVQSRSSNSEDIVEALQETTIQENEVAQELKKRAEELLRSFNVEGTILCCVPSGSRAYGTQGVKYKLMEHALTYSEVEDSNKDFIGVYVAPLEQVLSLYPPPSRVDESGSDSKQKVIFSRGMVLFECESALELLLQNNFRLMEAIFYDGPCYESRLWRQLKQVGIDDIVLLKKYQRRDQLICQQIAMHCNGVVESRLKSVDSNTSLHERQQNYYHALRLLYTVEHVLSLAALHQYTYPVYIDNEDTRKMLVDTRKGINDIKAVEEVVDRKKQHISELLKTSLLPNKLQKNLFNDWLLAVRLSNLT